MKISSIALLTLLIGFANSCATTKTDKAKASDTTKTAYEEPNVISRIDTIYVVNSEFDELDGLFDHISHNTHDIALPDTLYFAGEPVPMDLFYVRERLERELLVNSYLHSSTLLILKRCHRWFPTIEATLKKHGVPDDFKYLAVIESGLANVVSPSKAVGFWQFLEGTAKDFGLEVNNEVDMRYNVELEGVAACSYLQKSYQKFGSWTLAAAAYNAGNGRINQFIDYQMVDSYYDMMLSEETERYVFRILALKLIIENPEKYGFRLSDDLLYQPLDYKTVTVTENIPNLAEFAISNGVSYKLLKMFNPWLRGKSLTVKNGKSYEIKIPTGDFAKTYHQLSLPADSTKNE